MLPDPASIDSLAAVIRRVDGNNTLGAGALAAAIICEWALIYDYDRLVAAAKALPAGTSSDLDTALAPFRKG